MLGYAYIDVSDKRHQPPKALSDLASSENVAYLPFLKSPLKRGFLNFRLAPSDSFAFGGAARLAKP